MNFPEHQKLSDNQKEHEAIVSFLNFLEEKGLEIGHERNCWPGYTLPKFTREKTSAVIAEYFGVDEKKLEAEKRQMLDALQS